VPSRREQVVEGILAVANGDYFICDITLLKRPEGQLNIVGIVFDE
jgi:hypothetical protein